MNSFQRVYAADKLPQTLLKKNLFRSLFDIFSTWFFIFSLIQFGNHIWFIPQIIFIGIFQHRLLQLSHHGFHGDFTSNRKINDFFGRYFVTAPLLGFFSASRKNHLKHHSDFGGEYDFERIHYDWSILQYKSANDLIIKLPIQAFFSALIGYISRYVIKQNDRIKVVNQKTTFQDIYALFISQIFIILIMKYSYGSFNSYLLFWIFPGLFVGGFLNRIRNFLEHADPDPNATPYITFKSNLIERFILSPFNFNFHAEHHIYPAIPYYNICKARILLKIQGIENQVNYSLSYYSRFLYLVRKLKI